MWLARGYMYMYIFYHNVLYIVDSDVQITKFEPASASTSTDTLDASTLSTSTLSASPKGPLVDGTVLQNCIVLGSCFILLCFFYNDNQLCNRSLCTFIL